MFLARSPLRPATELTDFAHFLWITRFTSTAAASTAEFERDLLRERVRSGIAAARKRGVVFGRRPGQRIKADRCAAKVLKLVAKGQSYREISHRLGLSKNTVLDIVKRNRLRVLGRLV